MRSSRGWITVACILALGCSAPVTGSHETATPTSSGYAAVAAPTAVATPTTAPASDSPSNLGGFPAAPSNPFPSAEAAALQTALNQASERLPGVSATVIQEGRGTWTGVTGTADGTQAVQPTSQFGIASITKTAIAAEIMRLAEQGKLNLTDQVSDHLPANFAFDANGATIQDLLSMESGIPDPGLDASEYTSDPGRVWTPEEVLATVPSYRLKPGDHFVYEDANYMLLGLAIQRIAGTTVAQALRQGVLADPRFASLVYQPAERPRGPLALPFAGALADGPTAPGGGYIPSAAAASGGNGSGCMASDSGTLALFGYELFGGRLISQMSIEQMTQFKPALPNAPYGMGVFNQTTLADQFPVFAVGNGGWDDFGYSSELVVLPSEGIAISVLTNLAGDPVSLVIPIAQQLAKVLTT